MAEPLPDIAVMMLLYNNVNNGEDLRRALESLTAQTYQNFHLFVVDDCSADSSFDIAREFEGRFKHFTLQKNQKNKGVVDNLRDTLRMIEQQMPDRQFFIWACADDWWSPRYLEVTRNELLNHSEASVCQTWFDVHNPGQPVIPHRFTSITGNQYADVKRIFRPFITDGKWGFYNQSLHGLIRWQTLRHIYPDDADAITNVSCTELSAIITMFLDGHIIYCPEMLFHKTIGKKFVDKYPGASLTRFYKSNYLRIRACFSHIPRFVSIRRREVPLAALILLWVHLFYFYGILNSYLSLKAKILK